MCGCNNAVRARAAVQVSGHILSHAVNNFTSPRKFQNRLIREHVAVSEPSTEPEPIAVPLPVSVNRYPPRLTNSRFRGRFPHSVPEPVAEPVPEPVAEPQPVSVNRYPPRLTNSRFRGRYPHSVHIPTPVPQVPTYNAETTVWGPMLWKVLHTLAEFNTDSTLWTDLIQRLSIDIPCIICRTHFTTYINSNPIITFDTVSLINWFFTLHNAVNQRTGKLVVTTIPSFESFRESLPSLIQELSISFPPETLQILQQLGQNTP